jgi:MoaA/NifB/PqqE/SkfB family radical SAM enzyme
MYIPKSPYILCLELTKQCNISCKHCSVNADLNGKRELPFDKVIEIVEESKQIGIKVICAFGLTAAEISSLVRIWRTLLSVTYTTTQ